MPRCGRPARRAVSRPVCADEKNPALSVDRKLFGTSTIASHPARSAPAAAPHNPPRSADACRSAIGRPILRTCGARRPAGGVPGTGVRGCRVELGARRGRHQQRQCEDNGDDRETVQFGVDPEDSGWVHVSYRGEVRTSAQRGAGVGDGAGTWLQALIFCAGDKKSRFETHNVTNRAQAGTNRARLGRIGQI
jgi:hypothetical protein